MQIDVLQYENGVYTGIIPLPVLEMWWETWQLVAGVERWDEPSFREN